MYSLGTIDSILKAQQRDMIWPHCVCVLFYICETPDGTEQEQLKHIHKPKNSFLRTAVTIHVVRRESTSEKQVRGVLSYHGIFLPSFGLTSELEASQLYIDLYQRALLTLMARL